MSPELAKNFVFLITYLLPGFLAAWVFYGLTSHPKPTQFERVVQALIFTFIIQTFVPGIRWLMELLGQGVSIGPWTDTSESVTSFTLAMLFGATLAYITNADSFHKKLRAANFTSRTSHPSEWYAVLAEKVTYVILHLDDGRRLYGWPKEWPIECDRGQFYIMQPSWIIDDESQIELPQLDGILVKAEDVKWIEFLHMTESDDE
jgi:hypothetical protein